MAENTFYPAQHMAQLRQQAPLVHTNVAYRGYVMEAIRGPMLCVCATKDGTRKVAIALARRFPTIDLLPQGITTVIASIEALSLLAAHGKSAHMG